MSLAFFRRHAMTLDSFSMYCKAFNTTCSYIILDPNWPPSLYASQQTKSPLLNHCWLQQQLPHIRVFSHFTKVVNKIFCSISSQRQVGTWLLLYMSRFKKFTYFRYVHFRLAGDEKLIGSLDVVIPNSKVIFAEFRIKKAFAVKSEWS